LKEIIILDKCFWKELTMGITVYKNNEVIEHMLVILIAGLYLKSILWFLAPY
jgi:hypothetical protein